MLRTVLCLMLCHHPGFGQATARRGAGLPGAVAAGTFAHVTGQSAVGSALSGTTVAVTLANNPTPGNLVVLGILYYSGGASGTTITGIVDGASNEYTVSSSSPSTYDSSAGQTFIAYRLSAPANANKTITVTFAGAIGGAAAVWGDEFTYSAGTSAVDSNTPNGTGNGTTVNTPSIAVTGTVDLVYSVAAVTASVTAINSPWTANTGGITFGDVAAYVTGRSAATALNFACSNSGWTSSGISFK